MRCHLGFALLLLAWTTAAAAMARPLPEPDCACGQAGVCCRVHRVEDCHAGTARARRTWQCPPAPLEGAATAPAFVGLPRSLPVPWRLAAPAVSLRPALAGQRPIDPWTSPPPTPPPRPSRAV